MPLRQPSASLSLRLHGEAERERDIAGTRDELGNASTSAVTTLTLRQIGAFKRQSSIAALLVNNGKR